MITKVGARAAIVLSGVVLLTTSALTACSAGSPAEKVVTVTVPPAGAQTGSATGGTRTGSAGPSSGGTAASSGATTAQTALPGDCDSLLPDYAVARALGRSTLTGDDAFVVGVAEKGIGRLANINCRYGVSGATATATIEIGVSLYSTATQASARVSATAQDYAAHGAQSADVTVSGQQGQLLTGGVGAGYTDPLLVLAAGQRTVAVTVTAAIATGPAVSGASTKLAEFAVAKTAA